MRKRLQALIIGGTRWKPVLTGLNPDDPDFFNSFTTLNLKIPVGRQLIGLDMPYDVCEVFLGFTYQQVNDVSKTISIWLHHGGRPPTNINRFGWVLLDTIVREFGVSHVHMCTLIAHDKQKRFELLATKIDENRINLRWCVRAPDILFHGWSTG